VVTWDAGAGSDVGMLFSGEFKETSTWWICTPL